MKILLISAGLLFIAVVCCVIAERLSCWEKSEDSIKKATHNFFDKTALAAFIAAVMVFFAALLLIFQG